LKSDPESLSPCRPARPELLVAGVAAVLIMWLLVLPGAAKHPRVRDFSSFLEARGVDPNAKFFTDQQAGFDGSRQVMRTVSANSNAFWRVGSSRAADR
jgi:hypothetical protein